jgi:hypothetical protein
MLSGNMNRDHWLVIGVGAYFLVFIGGVVGLLLWKVKRRGGRLPVDVKLLRGPGESLRKRMADFDENFGMRVGGAAFIPLTAGLVVMGLLIWLWPKSPLWLGLTITGCAFLVALIPAVKLAIRNLSRNRSDRTGYLGERLVAEWLRPLQKEGYEVFHDMPAEGKKSDFNLDHITVGRTGVAVIETKTWRKGRPREDGSEYRVSSDGDKLRWPWGEDFKTMRQVIANAEWLQKFIHKRTAIDTPVRAVVAIPGWWVDEHARHQVAVVNEKNIIAAVQGKGITILSPEQVDLIARQIDEKCRDVEY